MKNPKDSKQDKKKGQKGGKHKNKDDKDLEDLPVDLVFCYQAYIILQDLLKKADYIGTKCDRLDRKVTEEEGKKLADELGVRYFETSAKTGYNVNEAYNFLIKEIIDNFKNFEREKIELKKDAKMDKKKKCSK